MKFLEENGLSKTRIMIHDFLLEQVEEKQKQVINLRKFADKVLKLLNSKYKYLKIIFEIES